MTDYDALVVGSGPNGLAAAITLAKAGLSVLVLEAMETIGGGMRTAELTLPGFRHDVCSAVHGLGVASPFMRSIPLEACGVEWIEPPVIMAHPLDDGEAVLLERSVEATADGLGEDGPAYRRMMQPMVDQYETLLEDILWPLPFPPRHPFAMARFGLYAVRSGHGLAKSRFHGQRARAFLAGMTGHSMLPLEAPLSASFGLVLTFLAHAVGWLIVRGGSQALADAMAQHLRSLGGEIATGRLVQSLDELPPARAVVFDVTPRQLLQIAGERLPQGYRRQLERFRYGCGVFKVDFALDGPVPWVAAGCERTVTLHLGGSLEEISASERQVARGEHAEKPFVLFAQPSLFDPTRAPSGKHTAWAYSHVPNGSTVDMTERIIAQVERFAPGFRQRILATATHNSLEMQAYNPNYIGGDINGGIQDWRQLFTRPMPRWDPYATPLQGVYLCSSSTPPGGGVHGMCGYHAAQSVLKRMA